MLCLNIVHHGMCYWLLCVGQHSLAVCRVKVNNGKVHII
jgi:hypothetical protein